MAFCSFILHFIILLVAAYGSCAGEIAGETPIKDLKGNTMLTSSNNDAKGTNVLRVLNIDDHDVKQEHDNHKETHMQHVHTHSSSHMDHMDPAVMVFFLIEDLKPGNTVPVYFPRRGPSSSCLLSKEEADSIPFALHQLPYLLHLFSLPQDSPQATAMKDTLRECETEPIEGETKFCATSLESMLSFVQVAFGSNTQVKVLSTTHITRSNTLLQNYTIIQIQEIPAPKLVACHTMPYAYAVFYCHHQESKSRVFKVNLDGENGDTTEAIAVCHLDTSHWSRKHVSFHVLGIEPGSFPVCHFFPADNFVWVPVTKAMEW